MQERTHPLKYFAITFVLSVLSFLFPLAACAAPGQLDVLFNGGAVAGPPGNTQVAAQSDGKVVMAGAFTSIQGIGRNRIARLNADGSLDSSFGNGLSGADNTVYCVAVQANGQILIGGAFTAVNGVSRNMIARLNSDGSLDNTFLNGLAGANDWVQSLTLQSDGRILIGGYFTQINGTTRNLLARLNADGSLDTGFLNGLAGANNGVFSIVIQPDSRILIGGAFTSINGFGRKSIARLNSDGALDESFLNNLTGGDGAVDSMVRQSDGKIVVVGSFTLFNGVSRNHIARLNSDGSVDGSFMNGLGGPNNFVYCVGLQTDGKVLVGGSFTFLNGFARNRIARLNTDGSVDDWFLNRVSGPNDLVGSLALQSDGKILIAGEFTSVNGAGRDQVARLLTNYGPPQIEDLGVQNGQMSFVLTGMPGQTLVVQGSTNLLNWTSLSTNFLGNGPPAFSDPQSSLFNHRFYRLLKL
jgi:uncharacterized delta-60 repeat protein